MSLPSKTKKPSSRLHLRNQWTITRENSEIAGSWFRQRHKVGVALL
jgi:hypothetical protein